MKKILAVLAVGLLLAAFACGGGKYEDAKGDYADAKKVMEETADTMEDLVAALEKAGSADDIVAAIDNFSDEMGELNSEMSKIRKKYNLENAAEIPDELKPAMERLRELFPKVIEAMINIAEYDADPGVRKAQEKLREALSGMSFRN